MKKLTSMLLALALALSLAACGRCGIQLCCIQCSFQRSCLRGCFGSRFQ